MCVCQVIFNDWNFYYYYYYYYYYYIDHFRLVGFYIEIDGNECYRWPNSSNPPTVFDVNCDQPGQHVTFRLPSNTTIVVFTLCEIQVFGKSAFDGEMFITNYFLTVHDLYAE